MNDFYARMQDTALFLVTDKACKARLIAHFADKNYKINILYSNEFDELYVCRNSKYAICKDMHEVREELTAIKTQIAKRGQFAINLFNAFVQRVLEKGFEPVHNTVFVTPN